MVNFVSITDVDGHVNFFNVKNILCVRRCWPFQIEVIGNGRSIFVTLKDEKEVELAIDLLT